MAPYEGLHCQLLAPSHKSLMIIPDELLSTPLWKWQLNGVTLVVILQLAKGTWTFVKENGGFRGIWSTLRGGKNEKRS
jgi:hypothetical protein